MYIVWFKFIVCALLIFVAGKRVARYADIIAEKTALGGLWIGLIVVSITTSLPEVFTGVGSIVFVDAPDLTVGNVLGANSYNLLNIGLLDLLERSGVPLLGTISSGQILTAALTLIPLMLIAIGIFLSGSGTFSPSIANVGIFSIAIFVSYLVITRVIYNFERTQTEYGIPACPAGRRNTKYENISLQKAYIYYTIAAVVIIASGIWLAYIGKELSDVIRLDESFIGSLFIGFATTLPEITVSVAALLIGAKEIAVANMIGSNLFNTTIIFIDDVLYRKAPILQSVSQGHMRTLAVVMAMTAVIILAMTIKSKRKFFIFSWYTPLIFVIFLLGAYLNFYHSLK